MTQLSNPAAARGPLSKIAAAMVAAAMVAAVFYFSFHQITYRWNWQAVLNYRSLLLSGWLITLSISIASLILSTFTGVIFALARRSEVLPLRYFSHIYVELVRGTPLLVQILVFFYVVADAFHVGNRYLVGVLILSFFICAYISDILP